MASIQLNKDDEWETPSKPYVKILTEQNLRPVIDVCATIQNRKCLEYFDKRVNGLLQDWNKDFFMNPPYSQVAEWVKKAYHEHLKWNVNGLGLIFSKTDTIMWHEYIEDKAEVYFIKGRIKFEKDGIPGRNSAPYPSCWVVWRKR